MGHLPLGIKMAAQSPEEKEKLVCKQLTKKEQKQVIGNHLGLSFFAKCFDIIEACMEMQMGVNEILARTTLVEVEKTNFRFRYGTFYFRKP